MGEFILGFMLIAVGGVVFLPALFGLLLILMGLFAEGGLIDLWRLKPKSKQRKGEKR